jgi:hypothetical protein
LKDLPLNDPVSLYFNYYNSAVNGCRFFRIDKDERLVLTYNDQLVKYSNVQ